MHMRPRSFGSRAFSGALVVAGAMGVVACQPRHIDPYVPKERTYKPPTITPPASATAEPTTTTSSLWVDDSIAQSLVTDARALREGDIVVVRIEESADARRTADTDIQRQSDNSLNLSAFLNAVQTTANPPSFSVEGKGGSGMTYRGTGSTARSEKLSATVPAMVRQVLPSQNLFIEGHRVVLVNNEEHHFYISGVIRPFDVDQQNTVLSSAVADAQIEFTGRGVLSDNDRQGVFSRFFGWIWPF